MMKKKIDLIGDDIHYGKVIFVTNSANSNLAKHIRKFLIKKRSIWKREDNEAICSKDSDQQKI